MPFADTYILKHQAYPFQIDKKIENLEYCIVIPVYNEPDIIYVLESLWKCIRPQKKTAVILTINSGENTSKEIIGQNEKTYKEVHEWIKKHQDELLHFFVVHHKNIRKKFQGAGMARKLGMDEAVNLLNNIDNENGKIISLDADTLVKGNYLIAIEEFYQGNKKASGGIIHFEHPTTGKLDHKLYEAIIDYELYLRYFVQALQYSGFPYSFHTIGSCFTITAQTYIKHGGMNRNQAGEDFYFLHKVFPNGKFGEINSTTVFPSARISDRVPFGTGPEIAKIVSSKSDYLTYNFEAFADLKIFISSISDFFNLSIAEIESTYKNLPESLIRFITLEEFKTKLVEIQSNVATTESFIKRFYSWFNAFKIIKYLNFIHESKFYFKIPMDKAAISLLQQMKINAEKLNKFELLEILRRLDKGEL